jgi:beta-glucosidase-like glycosyl hydrolase
MTGICQDWTLTVLRTKTPGEDPFRIKGYVKALIEGLEGNQSIRKVIATCKHYAGYDMERWNGVVRCGFHANISSQDLSEYYLPPFQQCARDSKAGSIMCSYNAINGIPACANSYIMKSILREHWGWTDDNNYVTSDCNAVQVRPKSPATSLTEYNRLERISIQTRATVPMRRMLPLRQFKRGPTLFARQSGSAEA